MSGHNRKTYFKIFLALGILTVVEIAIPILTNKYGYENATDAARTAEQVGLFNVFTPHWSSTALYFLSFAKASLVGLFFMHLKFETKWLKFIAILPGIAAFYALMLCAEAFYRHVLEVSGQASHNL
jgi:hypothetical protein